MQDKKPKIVGWGKLENQDGYSADNSLDKHNDRHTGTTFAEQRPPLGVGELVSETSAIVFSHWFVVILLGFVPSFIGQVLSGFLAGAKLSFGTQTFLYPGLGGDFASLLAGLISIVSFAITLALLVQFAYDAKLFRRFEFKRYIVTAFATLLPNAVLITIVVLAILGTAFFGFAFMEGLLGLTPVVLVPVLLVVSLLVCSVFSVTVPAVVISRTGFRGLRFSLALTKNYRLPIAAAIALTIVFIVILSMIVGLFVVLFGLAGGVVGLVLSMFAFAAVSALASGLLSVLITLIYARLREIKEGVSLEQIASIFD